MTSSESSWRQKIGWAKSHGDTLKREIRAFLDPRNNAYPVSRETDLEKSHYVFRVAVEKEFPASRWGLLFGDCVHNLRCSLDHLAWELAGGDPDDTTTQFVIAATCDDFRKSEWRLERLPEFARTLVEESQPYKGQNLGKRDALWLVQYLDNRDKHRVTTPTKSILSYSVVSGQSIIPAEPMLRTGGFEDGEIIARVPFTPPPKMDVTASPTFEITFGETLWAITTPIKVGRIINWMVNRVERILDRFDEAIRTRPS